MLFSPRRSGTCHRRKLVFASAGWADALAIDRPALGHDAHAVCVCNAGTGGAPMDRQLEEGQGVTAGAVGALAGGTARRRWPRGRRAAPAPDAQSIQTHLTALIRQRSSFLNRLFNAFPDARSFWAKPCTPRLLRITHNRRSSCALLTDDRLRYAAPARNQS